MSTLATVTFVENGVEIVKVLHRSDGYIDGVGHKLAEWLLDHTLVNGINKYDSNSCNCVGCLAAMYIRDFKETAGGLYIIPVGTSNESYDYNYRVEIDDEP